MQAPFHESVISLKPGSGLENHHSLRHGDLQDLTLVS
jgi:hypothetical protein